VLRPHPSEDPGYYEAALAPFANVVVIREGSVLKWIRAADLVVHSNCTTGIEAILAGRPAVNFLPGDASRATLDVEVAREAGTVARTIPAAMESAAALLGGTSPPHAWSRHAESILNNLVAEAIPILVDETLAAAHEAAIDRSRVVLPSSDGRRAASALVRSVTRRKPEHDHLHAGDIERTLDGCRAHGVGRGHITHATPQYVVIDPD
jgi:hypothetical protein